MNKFINHTEIMLERPSFDVKPLIRKQLFALDNNSLVQKCQYCQMKAKFGFAEKKCLQHSMIARQSEQQNPEQDIDSPLTPQQMKEMLQDVQEGLEYYWNNLHQISKGNPVKVQNDLQPVYNMTKRVQEAINKFFFQETQIISDFRPSSTQNTSKYKPTGSQKFNRKSIEYESFVEAQFYSATDSIKQWVMHFYKILALRQIPQLLQGEQLSFQAEDLEMRIFKQSMQRKFMNAAKQLQKNQNKIQQLLNKLIFYMQKSSETVPTETIQNDIIYLESNQQNIDMIPASINLKNQVFKGQQSSINFINSLMATDDHTDKTTTKQDYIQMLVLQATSLQCLINQHQQQSY